MIFETFYPNVAFGGSRPYRYQHWYFKMRCKCIRPVEYLYFSNSYEKPFRVYYFEYEEV